MKKNILYTIFTTIAILLYSLSINGASQNDIVSVNVLNHIYYGTLSTTGTEDIFTPLASSDTNFTITGQWSDSLEAFNGACIISYEDGTTQNVTYKKGLIHKKVTTTYPDGSYQTFSTSSGRPYKKILTYSADDKLIDFDWFHQCTPVSKLITSAISTDYKDLLLTPYDYLEEPIKITGTVVDIYERTYIGYIKIKDAADNLYLFKYPNTSIQRFISSNIENVSVNDSIIIYGFLDSINDYEENPLFLFEHSLGWELNSKTFLDELIVDDDFLSNILEYSNITDSDLEKSIPIFDAFYWKTDNTDINPLHLTHSYEELCKYPYYYNGEDITITGKVVYENTKSSDNQVILLIQQENSSEIYGVTYKTTDYTSLLNVTISCTGSSNGNCKIPYYRADTKVMGYALYPNIKASKLDFVSK